MIRRRTACRTAVRAVSSGSARETYCCLHVGMPKTATTSLQKHLFPNHSQIAYLGKFAGQNNKFPCKAVQAIDARLLGQTAPSARRCRIMISEHISPAMLAGRIPLWSKEGLTAGGAACKRKQARIFRKVMGDCKVIIYVRDPLKFMESMYFQNLKGFQKPARKPPAWGHCFGTLPRHFTIEQWLDVMWSLSKKGAFGHLLCAETADTYAEVFGKEQVRVFIFERLAQDPETAIGDLCRFIGVDAKEAIELFRGKRANDRWTVAQIERLKRIQESPQQSAIFRQGDRRTRCRMLGFDPGRTDDAEPKARAVIPTQWKERILEFARQEHRRLAEEWGLPLEEFGYSL